MNNLLSKLMIVLFLLLLLINNSSLVVISYAIDEVQTIIEQEKIKPVYELNLEKYVNYALDDETKGLMVQTNLKTGIEYEEEEEYKPLGLTGVILNLPKIKDEYPQRVEVIGKSTKATNGSDMAKDFNYGYDSSNGELKIVALNKADDDGNIYRENIGNARDEYTVIFYYGDVCYSDEDINRNIEINGKVLENLAEDETEITTEIKQSYEVNNNISGLISTNIQTEDIYDGFINSNNLNKTTYRTEYTENLGIDIGYKQIADELKIYSENSIVNNEEDEIIYKSTKIYKQDVLDKLGEEGYLKIFNTKGDLLGEVNKNTETLEDGTIEFKYEEEVTEIVINLSKPLNLGILNIQNTKQIKENIKNIENNKIKTTYNIEAINNIQKVDEVTGNVIENNEIKIYKFSDEVLVDIKEAETRIDLIVDTNEWTNNMQNDVTFTANLITNENKYNLFKNPVIEIKLPSEVENVILGDVSLLYGNGLNVKKASVIDKNSCKVIRVELEGNQSEYMLNSMITGANVLIPATIIVKKDITGVETNIETTYSNENGIINDYEKEGKNSKENKINIVSIIENDTAMLTSFAMPVNEAIDNDEISTEIMATVGNQILKNESSVYEEQIIKYTAKVTNNSDKKLSNVKFVGIVPEGTTYVTLDFGSGDVDSESGDDLYRYIEDTSKKEYSETFELNAHEEKEIFYEVKVNKLPDENEIDIESNLKVYNNNVEKGNYSIINKVKKADMSVELKSWITYIGDNIYLYRIKINNNKSEELQNINAELLVPDSFEVTETDYYEFEVAEEDNKIKVNLDKIDANETEYIDLYIKINKAISNVYEYNVNTYAVVQATGTEKYYSNENRLTAYMKGIEVIQTSEKEGKEVQYEEEIEYNFVIRNISNKNTFDGDLTVNIKDFLDENVEPVSAEYEVITYNEETEEYVKETKTENFKTVIEKIDGEDAPELQYNSELPIGQEIKLKLKVEAGLVNERTIISNNISVQYDKTTKISNTIKNILLSPNSGNDSDDDEDNENNNQGSKNSIDGKAWIDSNNDGQINENEEKYSNLKVRLYNVDSNSIVKDEQNNEIIVVTNENGLYKFNDISKGNYLVVFEYDNNTYNLASYKKSGVSEQDNSDVIEKQLQIGDDLKTVAVTDTLSVDSKDINNINIGLVPKQKYDLSLNKSITNVTVEYEGTKKENSYNETKLAKVEIPAKKVSKATVTVEYQMEVKNEGDVDAYVDEIIDYKPETLEFDGSLNPNWSNSANGKLSNSSLSGIRIKPGESKIVKLYLTKSMTDSSTGTIINAAEIGKSSNASNLVDIDSVEANKNENEDDYSEAQLIISIGTGAVTYTLIVIGLLIVLFIIRYLIKKNIIGIKGLSLLFVLVSVSVFVYVSNINISLAEDFEDTIINQAYSNDSQHNGKINLNYSRSGTNLPGKWYNNFYIHHVNVSLHNRNPGYLWCSDGRMMCSSGNHYYSLSKNDVSVKSITMESEMNDSGSINVKSGQEEPLSTGILAESGWRYVGPFSIDVENTKIVDEIDISVYASKNKTEQYKLNKGSYDIVSGIKGTDDVDSEYVDDDQIIKGKKFYIGFEDNGKNMEIEKVVIKLKSNRKIKGKASYTVNEKWRCTAISGTHSMKCSPGKMQVMLRSINGTESITEEINMTAKIVLKTVSKGKLQIIKVDDTELDNGKKISDVLDREGYDDFVFGENTINAGFAVKNDEYVSLGKLVGSDKVTKLLGMQFIICRVNKNDTIDSIHGSEKGTTYEFIKSINKYNQPSAYTKKILEYKPEQMTWKEYIDSVMDIYEPYLFTSGFPNDGEIAVDGLEEGIYRVIEVGKDKDYDSWTEGYEIEDYKYVDIYVGDDTINTIDEVVYIPNEKINTTSISGFIWKDYWDENGNVRDNVYLGGTDVGINDITVTLKDKEGNIVKNKDGQDCITKSSELNIYSEIEGGEYVFERVPKDKLGEYHVEFEYNGLIYQAVDIGAGEDGKVNSKAIEGTNGQNRIDLDNKFANGIVNNGSNSVKVNGRSDITVGYNETGSPGTKEIDKNSITGCDIVARTQVSGWDSDNSLDLEHLYEKYESKTVKYVNLGIYEKPQADLALKQDANNATVKMSVQTITETNGQITNIDTNDFDPVVYNYHKTTANDTTPNTNIWNEQISFKTNSYNKIQFYQGDTVEQSSNQDENMNADEGEEKEDEEPEETVTSYTTYNMYVTFKIAIVNQSKYNTITNSIAEYYSPDYEFLAARTESGQNLSTIDMGTVNGGKYKKRIIYTNLQTDSGKGNWIYIDFRVNDSALQRVISEGSIDGYSIAEIDSYKVFKDNYLNTVAAVDRDSVPGNVNPDNVEYYEDDTQDAGVGIIRRIRTLSGTVFEDTAIVSGEGNIREGNGMLDDSDKRLGGIKVTLKGPSTMTTVTRDDGSYYFEGFLPGEYEIIYTWGDNKYRVQDYKATIYKYGRNTGYEWYKDNVGTRYSDATDNYQTRIAIDDETAAITDRSIYDELDKAYNNKKSKITYTKMNSTTPKMSFGINYDSSDPSIPFDVNNVDFGIVERAVQDLDVEKKVKTFKVTLENGQMLIDAEIGDNGELKNSYENTIYIKPNNYNRKGLIKAEIDGELMEGALVEIGYEMVYTNKSELDYVTSEYYMYGSQASVKESELLTLKPLEVVDYLDQKLGFDASKNLTGSNEKIWYQIKAEKLKEYYPDDERPNTKLISERNLLCSTNKINDIKPRSKDTIYLNVSKLLSVSEDATFDNKIDTVRISKPDIPNGRNHRGRVVKDFPEAEAEQVQITPNTGGNRGYAVFIIVGILSLVILGVGIYFIKIKVID